MADSIEILDPLQIPEWDDLVGKHPQATFVHSSAWARLLVDGFGYTPVYAVARGNARLAAVVPAMEVDSRILGRRGAALPFTDYCPSLIDGDAEVDARLLVERIVALGRSRGWKSFHFSGSDEHRLPYPFAETLFTHELSLTEPIDAIRARFRPSTRRNLKRAEQSNLALSRVDSADAVGDYYRLHCMTRQRHGLFPLPRRFFATLHEHLLSQGYGFATLARHGRRVVAGAIFLHFNGHALYAHGASDKRYSHLRANNLVMWDAIKAFARKGAHTFSMGITDADNDGLRRFKRNMTGAERTVYTYRYDYRASGYDERTMSPRRRRRIAVCKQLPVGVLRAVGSVLYPHHG